MKDPGQSYYKRFNLVGLILTAVACLIIGRMVVIQFSPQAEDLLRVGEMYKRALHTYYPARGQIYDRFGHLLAGNTEVYEVAVALSLVENPETIAFAMSKVLENHVGYNRPSYYSEVFTIASRNPISGSTFTVVADFVSEEELSQLIDWAQRYASLPVTKDKKVQPPSLKGLVYRPRLQRIYPEKDLASNLLGFVNWDGKGIYGVEEKFNDLLAGEPELRWMSLDPYQAGDIPQSAKGSDLVLTLDREIQISIEHILDTALVQSGAEAGTILVMDPNSGEILAMATTPRLDLNQYWRYEEILSGITPFNRAISKDYEPGSVFKVLTMAAALDSGVVQPETVFIDTGTIEIGGIFIRNWNYGAWGPQDMLGCMRHSLNVCLAWIATELGPNRFYSYMQRFGIGHLTGVDIAGEVPGRLKKPGDVDWFESELGTNSFGQGVAVTTVQMLMAVSAIVNDGQMVAPHILRSFVNHGYQYNPPPTIVGEPISPETSRTLTEMLAISLEGESSDALVTGYRVSGKTGTAEIAGPSGYTSNLTHASFVGWGPVDDPRFLVYIWLEKPTVSPWGSVVAAPVFRDVVKELVILMNIPPDDVRRQLSSH